MSETRERHRPWLGYAIEEAIKLGVTRPDDVVQYATPDVLASQLPSDLLATLLTRSLSSGAMSPSSVLAVVSPALLAQHLDPEILWRCLDDVAALAEISLDDGSPRAEGRRWLAAVLARALETKMLTPADVLRHLPPGEFVGVVPINVVSELISSGVTRGAFNPDVVLTHLTPTVIADCCKGSLVWACVADGVTRAYQLPAAGTAPGKPTAAAAAPASPPAAAKPAVAAVPAKPAAVAPAAKPTSPAPKSDTGPIKLAPPPTKPDSNGKKGAAASTVGVRGDEDTPWNEDTLDVVEEQPLPIARK